MSDALVLRSNVVAVILAMAVVTYATKASGLWALGRVEISERVQAGFDALPGAVMVAFVAPALVNGGPAEWGAAAVTAVVAKRTGNLLLSLIVGAASVLALRAVV
ncbi:AzlD family protein [Halobacterium zhouii]|uniref:AzlD family protein n=1 Tax=Halobacterium zhouii TaxID=2902624 RepID=UPI001E478E91|nr:AzlD domain-containing protein [Halobacterium zhouii]